VAIPPGLRVHLFGWLILEPAGPGEIGAHQIEVEARYQLDQVPLHRSDDLVSPPRPERVGELGLAAQEGGTAQHQGSGLVIYDPLSYWHHVGLTVPDGLSHPLFPRHLAPSQSSLRA